MDSFFSNFRSFFYAARQYVRGESMDLEALLTASAPSKVLHLFGKKYITGGESSSDTKHEVLALFRSRGFQSDLFSLHFVCYSLRLVH